MPRRFPLRTGRALSPLSFEELWKKLKNESANPTTSVSSSVFTNSLGAALMKTSLARTAEKRTRELMVNMVFTVVRKKCKRKN